ncbi:unnamed protein product [Lampetra fluviatilis]
MATLLPLLPASTAVTRAVTRAVGGLAVTSGTVRLHVAPLHDVMPVDGDAGAWASGGRWVFSGNSLVGLQGGMETRGGTANVGDVGVCGS